jgi:hypothetical protein
VPALERDLVDTTHAPLLPGVPVDGALDPAVEETLDGFRRDAELASRVRHRRVDHHAHGPRRVCVRVRTARFVPRAPLRRRGVARAGGAAISFGPNLEHAGHVEQRQMAQAYRGIHPVQVATLPPTAATPGPVEGALDADEPRPLLRLRCREDTPIGQVQRHLNVGVHRDSSRSEPGPRSSHRAAPSGYDNVWFVTGIPGEPEIFVRVNSGGTKLDAADLMFAAIKSVWEPIEQNIEETVTDLNNDQLSFEKDFALKCLVTAHGRGATLTPEKFNSQAGGVLLADVKTHWQRAEDTFDQLRDFVVNDLKLYSTKVIRTYDSFVPLFDYLYNNPNPDPVSRAWMAAYYYKSQLFNWYSSGTDGTIDALHGIVGKPQTGFPLLAIKQYFTSSFDVEVDRKHVLDMRLRYIFLNMVYVARFGASPFNVAFKDNEPHIDHIYPQSMLKSRLGFTTSDVIHLGNYRFVGASDNLRKRAELPDSYFGRLKKSGVDISPHLLVPNYAANPNMLLFDRTTYLAFRDARLDEILSIAKTIVNPELP